MVQTYVILLLFSYFTFLISINTNKSLSKLFSDSNNTYDITVSDKEIDRLDKINNNNNLSQKSFHQRVLNERVKIFIIIGSISIGIMIIIVVIYITITYIREKAINMPEIAEQTTPLNTMRQTICTRPCETNIILTRTNII